MKLPKELSLQEIAAVAGGKVEGENVKVKAVALSPLAAGPGELALFFEPKLLARINECKAAAVMVPEGVKSPLPAVVVKRPLLAVQRMLSAVEPKRHIADNGVHPSAVVDKTAQLGENVCVGPLAVIGPGTKVGDGTKIGASCLIGANVKIGANCIFHHGAMVADYCQIGNRVILQQGASIGADGFSYVTERPSNMELRMNGIHELSKEPNPPLKIANVGIVILEDDVEIGACACVDRATMGATIIGAHSKIDNLVMIAHNCRIGKEVLIAGATSLAGSCVLGDRVILAGQVGLADHLKLADDVIVQGQGGVMHDLPEGLVACGSPAVPAREFMTQLAMIRRLPKVSSELKEMKKKIAELEQALAGKQLQEVKG